MVRVISRASCLLALFSIIACGSARSATRSPGGQRNLLSTDEMLAAGYADAFTTVQTLRPQWLRHRGATSINLPESIKVYLDGSLLGGPESMAQITVRSIATIQYLDALEATNRWGLDHGLGAILISTRREAGR
jgi:hypothetical protein